MRQWESLNTEGETASGERAAKCEGVCWEGQTAPIFNHFAPIPLQKSDEFHG